MTIVPFVAIGVIAFLVLAYLAFRHNEGISQYNSLTQSLHPLPMAALLNLIDPMQQEYLERKLPESDFRRLQRMRNRALIDYVWTIYRNAGILLKCAHAATQSKRPEVAAAGRELQNLALYTRTRALRSLFKLSAAVLAPRTVSDLLPAIDRYIIASARSTSLAALLDRESANA